MKILYFGKMNENNIFVSYLVVCTLCLQVTITSSRTSTLWKLNLEEGKITGLFDDGQDDSGKATISKGAIDQDEIFSIISSTVVSYENTWRKQSNDACGSFDDCMKKKQDAKSNLEGQRIPNQDEGKPVKKVDGEANDVLNCGKPVNFTYYDYLIGVAQRFNHPLVPEPEVAYLFLKNKDKKSLKNFDINALEKRLKRARKEKPRSVHLYNQIGNYWRIKGDARQSIECFRRALAISPTNAEVLLNLARVLFNLQYLDDAIHLTRRSLEVQPADRSAWRQYFTLGEIFKAYGHFQESLLHLRHALELYPQHEPILKVLRDVENIPNSPLHVYTIFIILALVLAVFVVILTSADNSESNSSQSGDCEQKTQRHFNRAMAMKSLKGLSSRSFKHRKY